MTSTNWWRVAEVSSDYRLNQFTADFRGYLSLGGNSVVAVQLLGTGLAPSVGKLTLA